MPDEIQGALLAKVNVYFSLFKYKYVQKCFKHSSDLFHRVLETVFVRKALLGDTVINVHEVTEIIRRVSHARAICLEFATLIAEVIAHAR